MHVRKEVEYSLLIEYNTLLAIFYDFYRHSLENHYPTTVDPSVISKRHPQQILDMSESISMSNYTGILPIPESIECKCTDTCPIDM